MVGLYANQTAEWKRKTGQSDYGTPVFDEPVTIRARIELRRRLVTDAAGHQVLSDTYLLTGAHVNTGDEIVCGRRPRAVLAVGIQAGPDGKELMREAYL